MNYYILNKKWFKKYQWVFIFLFNFPILKGLLRKRYNLKPYKKFVGILPNMHRYVISQNGDKVVMADVYYTDAVWSREVIKYIGWWLCILHWFDEILLDEYIPQMSFGFANLYEFYPDPGISGPTTDAYLEKIAIPAITWLQIRGSTGGTVYRHEGNILKIGYSLVSRLGNFDAWSRAYFSFDTSSLLSNVGVKEIDYYDFELYVTGRTGDVHWNGVQHVPWKDINNNAARIETRDWGINNLVVIANGYPFSYSITDYFNYLSYCFFKGNKPTGNNSDTQHSEVISQIGGIVTIALIPPESWNPWYDESGSGDIGDHGIYASPSDAGPSQAPRFNVVYKSSGGIVMIV